VFLPTHETTNHNINYLFISLISQKRQNTVYHENEIALNELHRQEMERQAVHHRLVQEAKQATSANKQSSNWRASMRQMVKALHVEVSQTTVVTSAKLQTQE
jgi:hypothetical protein